MTAPAGMDRDSFRVLEQDLVADLRSAGLSQRKALALIGLSRGSWHARTTPAPAVVFPVPHTKRRAASWLSEAETAAIISMLAVAFAAGWSVWQAFYVALDRGSPVASISSWYRVARRHLDSDRPIRRTRNRGKSVMPQWDATAAMQVWSWDITKLKGPYRNIWYDFYVVIDVFSRKIVGWRIEDTESGELAEEMFQAAISAHGGVIPKIVHSDGGTAMTSKTLTGFLRDLEIRFTKNRPRVSNDNPYSESWFKTAKYSPSIPHYFDDLDAARAWAATFVPWYNTEHRHTSLEGHTPASVHDGTWIEIHHRRQAVMDALAAANPDRYRKPIQVKTPYAHVALNTKTPEDRLTTG